MYHGPCLMTRSEGRSPIPGPPIIAETIESLFQQSRDTTYIVPPPLVYSSFLIPRTCKRGLYRDRQRSKARTEPRPPLYLRGRRRGGPSSVGRKTLPCLEGWPSVGTPYTLFT